MGIYRAPSSDHGERVPAIVAWSPFGKNYNGMSKMAGFPWCIGIFKDVISGLERFEGPDPAEYVPREDAVVNVDARGAGSVCTMGFQEAEDGYGVIEALAKLDWCSGSIGMAGRPHLGVIQSFIASLKPPNFKAIAPWEALGDIYREQFTRGGVFDCRIFDWITQ